MSPIELLNNTLKSHERSKQKAIKSFEKEDISEEVYNMYMSNLNKLITEYSSAITNLNKAIGSEGNKCANCEKLKDAYKMLVIKDLKHKGLQ